MWVIKVSSTGTKVWASALGGNDDDQAFGLVSTSDGGYMVSGFTYSTDIDPSLGAGYEAEWLVKLTATGSQVWQQTYGGGGSSSAQSDWLLRTANGGIVSGGSNNFTVSWLFEIK